MLGFAEAANSATNARTNTATNISLHILLNGRKLMSATACPAPVVDFRPANMIC